MAIEEALGLLSDLFVMLSIWPRYAEAILSGEKTVEFRRKALPPQVKRLVLYATAPMMRVVGTVEVEAMQSGSPTALWREFAAAGAIPRAAFRNYFAGCRQGCVILLRRPRRLKQPLDPRAEGWSVRPGQYFVYVREGDAMRLACAAKARDWGCT